MASCTEAAAKGYGHKRGSHDFLTGLIRSGNSRQLLMRSPQGQAPARWAVHSSTEAYNAWRVQAQSVPQIFAVLGHRSGTIHTTSHRQHPVPFQNLSPVCTAALLAPPVGYLQHSVTFLPTHTHETCLVALVQTGRAAVEHIPGDIRLVLQDEKRHALPCKDKQACCCWVWSAVSTVMPLVPVSCQIVAVCGSALVDSPSACCFRFSTKGILARDSVLFMLC